MDLSILQIIFQYAIAPLTAFCLWTYKTQISKMDELEARVASIEKSTAVIEVLSGRTHQDINEMKRSLEKMADKL